MRRILFAGLLSATALAWADPASAAARYEGPWCAFVPIGDDAVSERCDMRSFDMCLAEIQGTGGTCGLNPYFKEPDRQPQRAKRARPRS